MNIKQLHTAEKAVSANALLKGEKLKEHTTKTPA